jgi:hypothetical protein
MKINLKQVLLKDQNTLTIEEVIAINSFRQKLRTIDNLSRDRIFKIIKCDSRLAFEIVLNEKISTDIILDILLYFKKEHQESVGLLFKCACKRSDVATSTIRILSNDYMKFSDNILLKNIFAKYCSPKTG